ncbi:hypothetical protein [Streptomyces sp. NPDC008139]|uniref:hypothetical protein n=1 Tax=Streptomyces sp. NPDC008139 TaxID=3364814 RepID=UPI0036E4CD72
MGLLEERERAVRRQVEALQAELREAEAVLERFVIARETVGQVLAEPRCGQAAPPAVTDRPPVPGSAAGAVPGSVVPVWRDALDAGVLARDYQRIMNIVADPARSGGEGMDCRELAAALGLAPVPAKVEGVRVKAKRLVARGWLAEDKPGKFSAVAGRGGGS